MRKLSILVSIFIISAIPGIRAAEFSGTYDLSYPHAGMNINFGIVEDGQFTGFDETIPLGVDASAFFTEKEAEALAILDALPGLPEDMKDQLRILIQTVFDSISTQYLSISDQVLALLPASFQLTQLFWPFDSTMWVTFDALPAPWPGTINASTGDFELLTLSLPLYSTEFGDSTLSMIGILLGDGRIDPNAGYDAEGNFRADYEIIIENAQRQIILGVGAAGEWSGVRN
jgi:hypothetical protein